jgi:hypothetical protein
MTQRRTGRVTAAPGVGVGPDTSPYPIHLLAARHKVHRRTVRQALATVTVQRWQVHTRFTRVLEHTRTTLTCDERERNCVDKGGDQ